MRRMMLFVFAVGLLGSLAGCYSTGGCGSNGCRSSGCGSNGCGSNGYRGGSGSHSLAQGFCDCEDDNHCRDRSPWVQMGAPAAVPASEAVPVLPAKLPDGKKGL